MNQTKQKPLVSVIMPVYNAETFLPQAIESVLMQSYDNLELVIVDDCSKDDSWKIITNYRKLYPKTIIAKRLTRNRNMGGDAAANEAFALTHGEFIARTDADDVMHPKRLEKQVAFIQKHKDIAVLGTWAEVINGEGEIIGKKIQPTTHEAIYRQYFINHPMINPSIMFRRSQLLSRKQLYLNVFPHNNDLYTFFKMLTSGKQFANLPQKLMFYRVHGNNDSLKNFKVCFWNTLKIRLHAVKYFGYRPTAKAVVITAIQVMVALLLPEDIIRNIYLVSRGMHKIEISMWGRFGLLSTGILKKYALILNAKVE